MLESITVRNFKAFAGHHPFRLAPLSFIVGANSTGKSTIIQALLVLRQSWRDHDDLPLDLRTEGVLAHLGRPSNVVSGQSLNVLELGVTMPGAAATFGYDFRQTSKDAKGQALTHLRLGTRQEGTYVSADVMQRDRAQIDLVLRDVRSDGERLVLEARHGEEHSLTLSEGVWTTPSEGDVSQVALRAVQQHLDNARRALEQVQYVGPLRASAQRHYTIRRHAGQRVGVTGDRFVSLLYHSAEITERVNELLRALDLPYLIHVHDLGGTAPLGELQLEVLSRDFERRSEPLVVGLPDVGCGLSQLLPILTQLAAAEVGRNVTENAFGQTVLLEQPELHLHPAAQVALGDLLVDFVARDAARSTYDSTATDGESHAPLQDSSALARRKRNQIVVETHSEHLVNQVRTRVALGELDPQDVMFLIVHRSGGLPDVVENPMDARGEFHVAWPEGFFSTQRRGG